MHEIHIATPKDGGKIWIEIAWMSVVLKETTKKNNITRFPDTLPETNIAPRKLMVGRLHSFWDTIFQAILVLGNVNLFVLLFFLNGTWKKKHPFLKRKNHLPSISMTLRVQTLHFSGWNAWEFRLYGNTSCQGIVGCTATKVPLWEIHKKNALYSVCI